MLYGNHGTLRLYRIGNVKSDEWGARWVWGVQSQWLSQKLCHGHQKEGKACASVFEVLLGQAGKKRKTVAGFTVRKWMRTERHIFQSNGDKQRGFGCLVREKKKEWKKPELKSLQRRLFAEKCQRSYYPICTVSTAKQTSLSLFNSLSPSACKHTSHYLLRVMDQNLSRNKRQRSI